MLALLPAAVALSMAAAAGEAPPGEPLPAAAPASAEAGPDEALPAAVLPAAPRKEPVRLVSLVGAPSLGPGGVMWLGGVGFPYLLAAYGQGIGDRDDLGGQISVNWARGEFVLSGFWRREVDRSAPSHLALRGSIGFFAGFGATWIYSDNAGSDEGVQLSPGIAWSLDTPLGLLTVAADLPFTWTFERGMGWIFAPEASLAFEVPVRRDLAVGLRAGVGLRAAGGGAPGAGSDTLLVDVAALLSYRVF